MDRPQRVSMHHSVRIGGRSHLDQIEHRDWRTVSAKQIVEMQGCGGVVRVDNSHCTLPMHQRQVRERSLSGLRTFDGGLRAHVDTLLTPIERYTASDLYEACVPGTWTPILMLQAGLRVAMCRWSGTVERRCQGL